MVSVYHAHIYFEAAQTSVAERVRQRIAKEIPQLSYLGKLIPMPIGPHPKPMFEIHIPMEILDEAIVKIETLRESLSVLIHPVYQDDFAAHTQGAKWLGNPLPLNLTIFKKV